MLSERMRLIRDLQEKLGERNQRIADLERELESISGVASSQNELLEELREYITNLEADVTRLQEKPDSIEYDD